MWIPHHIFDFNKESDPIMRHKPEQDIIVKNEHKEETIIKKKNIYTPRKEFRTPQISCGTLPNSGQGDNEEGKDNFRRFFLHQGYLRPGKNDV